MANISQEAVLSAAWMLIRRAREAGSAVNRSDTSGQVANHVAEITLGGQAYTKEAVRRLIAAYLDTPTHVTSPFNGW